jgi:hypothetical protein
MKRIIIAMIMACGAIFAAFGNCSPEPTKETAWVYKWKFTGKTTKGEKTYAKVSACSAGNVCSVRCPTSLKIEGYTWACSPGCGDEFGQFAEANEVFWSSKPSRFSLAGGVQNEIMHIIGKKKKQAEVGGLVKLDGSDMTYNLTYAGLGKYSTKKGHLTSASGSFAGFGTPCPCAASACWSCESLSLLCDENPDTVVYGKWSVKYKKSASKRFARKSELPKLPRWATMRNSEGI